MFFCKRRKIFLFIILVGLILITGCSSSSNSIRYGSGNERDNEDETEARYHKDEEKDQVENIIPQENDETDLDESPDDLSSVDISILQEKFPYVEGNSGIDQSLSLKEKMLLEIIRYMNTPYKFGGNSQNGIDCSAFTQTVYGSCALQLLRSAREQFTQGIIVENKEELKFGDLVFFNTRRRVKPGHVGIYLGDNLFVHASSKHGVIVTPLTHEYYTKRYMGARRIDESVAFQ